MNLSLQESSMVVQGIKKGEARIFKGNEEAVAVDPDTFDQSKEVQVVEKEINAAPLHDNDVTVISKKLTKRLLKHQRNMARKESLKLQGLWKQHRKAKNQRDGHQHRKQLSRQQQLATLAHENRIVYDLSTGLRWIQPYLYTFQVHAKGKWLGKTILDVFCTEFWGSAAYFQRSIEAGKITINGLKVSIATVVKPRDWIEHYMHRHEPPVLWTQEFKLVEEESDELIVVNKPATIPVHPCGPYRHNSLTFILEQDFHYRDLHTIHRLDRLTSGLVLLAKSLDVARRLTEEMTLGKIRKKYWARVTGRFPAWKELGPQVEPFPLSLKTSGRSFQLKQVLLLKKTNSMGSEFNQWQKEGQEEPEEEKEEKEKEKEPIGYDAHQDSWWWQLDVSIGDVAAKAGQLKKICGLVGGKESTTFFRFLHYFEEDDTSLVECRPFTGRTHQIRAHLEFLGFPIANDPLYTGDESAFQVLFQSNENTKGMENLNYNWKDETHSFPSIFKCQEPWNDPSSLATETPHAVANPLDEMEKDLVCECCEVGIQNYFRDDQIHHKGIWLHALEYQVRACLRACECVQARDDAFHDCFVCLLVERMEGKKE